MRRVPLKSLALLALLALAPARAQDDGNTLVQARLGSDFGAVWPGREARLAVVLQVSPGWHVYWKNPGDSGMATSVTLSLPPGLEAGEVRWPAPTRFVHDGSVSLGYEGEVTLIVPVRAAADLAPDQAVRVKARVDWLVCTAEACLPGGADVEVSLHVAGGPAAPTPTADAARLARAAAKVAAPAAPADLAFAWTSQPDAQRLTLRVPGATRLEFYPWLPEDVGPRDLATRGVTDGDALELLYPLSFERGVAGVLAVRRGDGPTRFHDVVIPARTE